ncbi:MAG: sulfatase [Verrucomicrobia bacterium]|nr:sulfatase [Verrucomicrobiota bacterium]MCF7708132.1 sulfatase [Verrucomicrobiota bacterium]
MNKRLITTLIFGIIIYSLTGFGVFDVNGAGREEVAGDDWARPNIIFFLTDDQRNDTLGCAGHSIIKTPVIDRLAEEGVRFENAFVTTSICAASRASIFTGVHERTHGYTFGKPPVPKSIAQAGYPLLLKEAGYRTGFIGKYGCAMEVGADAQFDYFVRIGRNPYFHELPDGGRRHETDLCADKAIKFIEEQSASRPFCLSISFNAAHAEDSDKRPGMGHFPWPPSVDGMYEDITPPAPRLSDSEIFEVQPKFLKDSLNRQRYFWRWDTPEKYKTNMRAYFRMISGIDHAIGRVITKLEKTGMAGNTVIIYAADNGYYMGDRGFAGKWSHYEESLRIPLIIYDPRLPEGSRSRVVPQMALNIDIPATILDAAGLGVHPNYQGRSLLPIVRGESPQNWRDDFFCEHLMDHPALPKWEGVRGRRYVYARYFEQEPAYEFLHDLETDPDELKNLAGTPEYTDVLDKMRERTGQLKNRYTVEDAE